MIAISLNACWSFHAASTGSTVDDIIDDIRAMGNDGSHLSGQGARFKQVLLQTIEEIMKFVEGKPIEKVDCEERLLYPYALVV